MSILIIGVEMPKEGCKDCPIVKRGRFFDICPFLKREVNGNVERGGKPYGCPLIGLPDHGDLIEKDPLFKKAEELEEQASAEFERYKMGETNWEQTEKAKWRIAQLERRGFKYEIADAPVVIPAESEIDKWWERNETVNAERSEHG